MRFNYLLPETVVVVEGTIERTHDQVGGSVDVDYGHAEVSLAVRGDEGAGARTLEVNSKHGDEDWTIEWAADRRLSGVSYKSTGVGSRVLSSAATVVAVVAGAAARASGLRALRSSELRIDPTEDQKGADAAARQEWDQAHADEAAHSEAYTEILAKARKQLIAARLAAVEASSQEDLAAAVARAHRLESVAAAAEAERNKVVRLYELWRESKKTKATETRSFTMSLDTLPRHTGGVPDVAALDGTAADTWKHLGVVVEVGPATGRLSVRPSPLESSTDDDDIDVDEVAWRIPRQVRLWVWRRGDADTPVLDRSFETSVVDRFSDAEAIRLEPRVFGEEGGSVAFDASGALVKLTKNTKSAMGAVADAFAGLPGTVAGALESFSKSSTSLGALSDADAERRLATLKRQVEQQQNELTKKGLDATADDFALLKRLEQQVAVATANRSLAPAARSAVDDVKDTLALETARHDLETVTRARVLDAELAGAQAEIARLSSLVKLKELQKPDA